MFCSLFTAVTAAVWNPFSASPDEIALFVAIAISTFVILDALCDIVFEPVYRRLEAKRLANVRRILSRSSGRC